MRVSHTRVDANDQLVHKLAIEELQRFAELGRLTATLLHEMSAPLASALLYLEQQESSQDPHIRHARRSLQQLRRYVEAARQQLRRESPKRTFRIGPSVAQVRRLLAPFARVHQIQLTIDPAPDFRLYGDPVKFQQILTNLIVNAIEAYRNDTSQELARPVRVRFKVLPRLLTIHVIDWGEGIPLRHLAHIFEPFYSTKHQTGYGLGIGLAIVKQYVSEDFNGSIHVASTHRGGTRFTIALPAAQAT